MQLNLDRVREHGKTAPINELLDEVTIYRGAMEPEAVEVLKEELYRRKVTETDIVRHGEEAGRGVLWERPGLALRCVFCRQPATRLERRWFRFLGLIPLFPRVLACCPHHQQTGQRSAISDQRAGTGSGPATK